MRKIIFGAMAAAALLACSKDQVLQTNQNGNEITYSIEAENQTKASAVYCQNNLMSSFTVRATYNNGTINKWYYTEIVTREGTGTWTGEGIRYWSEDGTHDFYACANGTMTVATTPAPPTVTDFTPNTTVASQLDLLYAVTAGLRRATTTTVALKFRHALSQVEFRAKNTNPNLHVIVKGVRVGQVPSKGTFTFPAADAADGFVDHDQDGTHSYTPGTWSLNTTTKADYGVSTENVAVTGNNNAVDLTISTDASGSTRNFSKSMLLLPTSSLGTTGTTAWNPTNTTFNGTYIAVNCDIYNVEGSSFNASTDVQLHSGWAVIPVAFKWEPGKKYIYTFVFGDGNGGYEGGTGTTPGASSEPVLAPVSYQIAVDDFEAVTDKTVDMEF